MDRCKLKPPHISPSGTIKWHATKKDCDDDLAAGAPRFGASGGAPDPAPAESAKQAPAQAPPAPKSRMSFIRVPHRPAVPASEGGPLPVAQRPPIIEINEEWELSDELSWKFFAGLFGIVRMVLRMWYEYWEIDETLIEKRMKVFDLADSDQKLLGSSFREVVGTAFKRAGVKTLARAEQIINNMGGGAILVKLGGEATINLIRDTRASPKWKAMQLTRRQERDAANRTKPTEGQFGRGGAAPGAARA